jgi:type II secretory pathway pseudopilin PulG
MVVIAIIAILSGLVLPALSKAKSKGRLIACSSNLRQLHLAWTLYGDDHQDNLAYNLGAAETKRIVAEDASYDNWVNNVLNWELDSDNTNLLLVTEAGLGPYCSRVASIYRCPSDWALSPIQKDAGWTARVRSLSMNAMVGNVGEFARGATNVNNPAYRQYLKASDFDRPAETFVFVEEHPDSINDGYFLNKVRSLEWLDLPASFHDGAGSLVFADGHLESRRWRFSSTKPPPRPDAADLPFAVPPDERGDFEWLMRRTTVYERHID